MFVSRWDDPHPTTRERNPAMPELAYVNGEFMPIADASISIEDRGMQFGDGVYEVIVAYDGRLFQVEMHMERLRRSATGIGLEYDFDNKPLEGIIRKGLQRSGLDDAMIYLQLTRGTAPRVHLIPKNLEPTVIMTFKPRPVMPEELVRRGMSVMTTPETRWANCYIKAITLLPNILARTEADRRGYDDAIFITDSGEVRECTASNIFIVTGNALRFPPRNEAVLHGVTQNFLLDCATAISLEICEEAFDVTALRSADEVFMSGTSLEVMGITSIDGKPVGDGQVGAVTKRLHAEFLRRVREPSATVR